MKDLPQFQKRSMEQARDFAAHMLTTPHATGTTLRDMIAYEDGHFRALFDLEFFQHGEEEEGEPSKSQWNTLKKKFKRHEPRVFLFKEHGVIQHDGEQLAYLDFGFFAE
jgi:hypothetical protein